MTTKEVGANFEAMMCCSVLQYDAVRRQEQSPRLQVYHVVLQCGTVCCSVLQRVAVRCSVLR